MYMYIYTHTYIYIYMDPLGMFPSGRRGSGGGGR